ncbi:hypothetical protein V7S43_000928 [Phytophthora oleae]|uniref:Uncharacterized protein n=1 Tax=Phytophthora oleae TaxID=2107226 RepID=A0ABD3G5C2_9STRA
MEVAKQLSSPSSSLAGILPQHVKEDERVHLGLLLLLFRGHTRAGVFSPGRQVGEGARGHVLLGRRQAVGGGGRLQRALGLGRHHRDEVLEQVRHGRRRWVGGCLKVEKLGNTDA